MFDKTQPLWLPKGSGRLIMALALVAAVIAQVGGDTVATLATAVIAFYFGFKSGASMPEHPGADSTTDET